ncbi:uncharacterized protein LOC121366952 [Gigantopelta aegis]|uniref:uncharacterized protein LOC121366952 n=1 Tax=Gigantopelta aegis TaxID=1735272 RepID=UPI001B8878EE|nr:uncharacterized protein LOC121366952 [Gigantopelta aegis]
MKHKYSKEIGKITKKLLKEVAGNEEDVKKMSRKLFRPYFGKVIEEMKKYKEELQTREKNTGGNPKRKQRKQTSEEHGGRKGGQRRKQKPKGHGGWKGGQRRKQKSRKGGNPNTNIGKN